MLKQSAPNSLIGKPWIQKGSAPKYRSRWILVVQGKHVRHHWAQAYVAVLISGSMPRPKSLVNIAENNPIALVLRHAETKSLLLRMG